MSQEGRRPLFSLPSTGSFETKKLAFGIATVFVVILAVGLALLLLWKGVVWIGSGVKDGAVWVEDSAVEIAEASKDESPPVAVGATPAWKPAKPPRIPVMKIRKTDSTLMVGGQAYRFRIDVPSRTTWQFQVLPNVGIAFRVYHSEFSHLKKDIQVERGCNLTLEDVLGARWIEIIPNANARIHFIVVPR